MAPEPNLVDQNIDLTGTKWKWKAYQVLGFVAQGSDLVEAVAAAECGFGFAEQLERKDRQKDQAQKHTHESWRPSQHGTASKALSAAVTLGQHQQRHEHPCRG